MTDTGTQRDKEGPRKRIKLEKKEGEEGLYENEGGIVERTEVGLEVESRLVATRVLEELVSRVEGQIDPKPLAVEPEQPTKWLRTAH